jgi:hypothetical protein
MTGVRNNTPRTPSETTQRISAILGKYKSLNLSFLRIILVAVEIATINTKSPIPTTGPTATKTTDRAAGKKIPKPLRPISCLTAAMIPAAPGRRSRRTIVFGGTPALTAPFIEYLRKLKGKIEPNFCSFNIRLKGSVVSSVFWVRSVLGTKVGIGISVAKGASVAEGEAVGVILAKDVLTEKMAIKTKKINIERVFFINE